MIVSLIYIFTIFLSLKKILFRDIACAVEIILFLTQMIIYKIYIISNYTSKYLLRII